MATGQDSLKDDSAVLRSAQGAFPFIASCTSYTVLPHRHSFIHQAFTEHLHAGLRL